jgi:hypothetical protein
VSLAFVTLSQSPTGGIAHVRPNLNYVFPANRAFFNVRLGSRTYVPYGGMRASGAAQAHNDNYDSDKSFRCIAITIIYSIPYAVTVMGMNTLVVCRR